MSTQKELKFTLTLKEHPVTIDEQDYVLVELTGKGRDSYLDNVSARMKVTKTGESAGVKSFDGMQAFLLGLSIKKIVDGKQVAVTVQTIQTWPAGVVGDLFDAAKELSDLGQDDDDDEDDEEKND